MKYAVISDIHGNLEALKTVLSDAEAQRVDGYILLGDYCLSNPEPDACVTRIRNLPNAHVIRGNEERYFETLMHQDQRTWTDGQMEISYWCYRNLSPENRAYLLSLPQRLELTVDGVPLHIAHSSAEFIGDREHREWGTWVVSERYPHGYISFETFTRDIHRYFDRDAQFQQRLSELPPGVYLFGHCHIQWHYASDDGRVVLLDAGSCGLPLECVKDSIPYTILELTDGTVRVEERRLPFDFTAYVERFRQSRQYREAPVWSRVIARQLSQSRDCLVFFLQFVERYAQQIGDDRRPYVRETWEQAYDLWESAISP